MKKTVLFFLIACMVYTSVFAQDSVFVSARGNNENSGLTETEPVKTLARAIRIANQNNSINKITVIGTLNTNSEGMATDVSVFGLTTNNREILVTGKPDASRAERAVLSAAGSGKISMTVIGNTRIRFENIEISGSTGSQNIGLFISGDAHITLGPGAAVRGNFMGVLVSDNGTLVINGGEVRNNTSEGISLVFNTNCIIENGEIRDNGGMGILVANNGVLVMRNGTIRSNRDGGVAVIGNGRFTMHDGTITGNRSNRRIGGVFVNTGATFDQTGGTINRNTAVDTPHHNVHRVEGSLGSDLVTR